MNNTNFVDTAADELVIDLFAGGGGASTGIAQAIGRSVDVAIDNDPVALAMHAINSPGTKHICNSLWDVSPLDVTMGKPVGLLWLSPPCTHFSRARAGMPVEAGIRDLACVAFDWITECRPRVIILENVEEFHNWAPLVTALDGKRHPDPRLKGSNFDDFVEFIYSNGYFVKWRVLSACDYGAPTTRRRLFLIARCDGRPIVWPKPTHRALGGFDLLTEILPPYRTAAECIDFGLPAASIFARKKPLAENTMRRIANGLCRHVLESGRPYIIASAEQASGGTSALVTAYAIKYYGRCENGFGLHEPMHTLTTKDRICIVQTEHLTPEFMHRSRVGADRCAGLMRNYSHTLFNNSSGLVTMRHDGADFVLADIKLRMLRPKELFLAQGFCQDYVINEIPDPKLLFDTDGWQKNDRFGNPIDASLLPRIQLTLAEQTHMCGNSVCPPVAAALVRANLSN